MSRSSAADNRSFWIGIDLAAETFDAAVAFEGENPGNWRQLAHEHFTFDRGGVRALLKWVKQHADLAKCSGICAEATGKLAESLQDVLESVRPTLPRISVVNPRHSVRFGESLGVRDKSDRIDCAILAIFGLIRKPEPSAKLSDIERELKELSRALQTFEKSIRRWENRLDTARSPILGKQVQQQIKTAKQSRKQIELRIAQLLKEDTQIAEDVRLLDSVPGIGPVTALGIIAEMGDLRKYSRGQVTAYAGLYPREHTSGKSVYKKPRMPKGPGKRVKALLYNGAKSLFRSKDNTIAHFLQHLLDEGKSKMAALGAVMRKILLTARAVLISRKKYDPNYAFLDE